MIRSRIALVLCALSSVAFGQLTTEQKISDFRELVALYDKNYGPYEWKRDVFGFDLLNIGSWEDRIRATTNDLDFYEIMVDYVAHLQDSHDTFTLPSNFSATLNIAGDLYDGKLLIDSINRGALPQKDYPFQIGDEVVSVDGKDVEGLIASFAKYAQFQSNPRSARRGAAARIFSRPQAIMPHATDVGDTATVVIRDRNGDLNAYTIPWTKIGLPLVNMRPVPSFASIATHRASGRRAGDQVRSADYMSVLHDLWNCSVPDSQAVLNFGGRSPIFTLPSGFTQRLGRNQNDFFYSGTYSAGGYRIGFIRIPTYSPPDLNTALGQFLNEVAFLDATTDGLIINDMRNPGGNVAFVNYLAQMVTPYRFRTIGFEVRSTSNWIIQISSALESAKAQGAERWIIDLLGALKDQLTQANSEFRGRTGPISLDDVSLDREPFTLSDGTVIAYHKPIIVLVDDFSASAGDAFAATLQDNDRAMIVGYRTMGAGGNVTSYNAGTYSEGAASITQSLMNRKNAVVLEGFPAMPYVENMGVQPDLVLDYMTRDNLLQGGKPFVDAFTAAMVDYIKKGK